MLKWALVNEAGLVFVLIYNKAVFSNITYVDELLTKFKEVRSCYHDQNLPWILLSPCGRICAACCAYQPIIILYIYKSCPNHTHTDM